MSRTFMSTHPAPVAYRRGRATELLGVVSVLAVSACAGATGSEASGTEVGGPSFVPLHHDTVPAARFIFVGDTGTGDDRAWSVATQIRLQAEAVPVSHVFLLGDNLYEFRGAESIADRFLDPYRDVLLLGVRIHSAVGNHDLDHCADSGLRPVGRDGSAYRSSPGCSVGSQLARPEFGYLDGFRYYSIEIPGGLPDRRGDGGGRPDPGTSAGPPLVEVFVLDTNTLGSEQTKLGHGSDEPQLRWLSEALQSSSARWKIVAMHHPVYSPTRCQWFGLRCRREDEALKAELEPIFLEHGVDVVFQAHQHLYARLRPQGGIRYFVTGGGGRKPDSFREDERTLPRDDRGSFNHFVYVSASEDRFAYCVIDSSGDVRDGGTFRRGDASDRPTDRCPAQALDPASARPWPARQVGSASPSVTRTPLGTSTFAGRL